MRLDLGSRNRPAPATARDTYIELSRRFGVVDKKTDAEAEALESYAIWDPSHKGSSWEDLLRLDRVVVLGEAGSGKTWELRKRAEILRAAGRPAFFVRLDRLKDGTLTQRWNETDRAAFQAWQRGGSRALFFLDSVDESKFRRATDFYDALDVFVRDIGQANLDRATVILSSRVSEWHPETDATAVVSRLGATKQRTARNKHDGESPALHVFQIMPLDEEQAGRFAEGRGVADVPGFLRELHRANAGEFARRPVDVVDLVTLWQRDGRLGTLTELIEAGLEARLRETSERSRTDPLTPRKARAGAESLAAAVSFCRNFNFRVPDDGLIAPGLDGRACVGGDWQDGEYQSLLARPLFDAASFGLVRFHHRRTQEYLASCWVAERMRQGCPVTALRDLFFDSTGSRSVLRPSLAPLAAWLCAGEAEFNLEMRRWVLDDAPAIHLRYGDPQRLTLAYKRDVLSRLATAGQARKRMWFKSDPATLARLAEAGLEADAAAYVADTTIAIDFRSNLLEMGGLAKFRGMTDAALSIAGSPTEPDGLKAYALRLLHALDDPSVPARLAAALAPLPAISDQISASVLRTLFPGRADVATLAAILAKIERRSSGYDSRSEVGELFAEQVAPEDAGTLLASLVTLVEQVPAMPTGGNVTISQRHGWVAKQIGPLVKAMLLRPALKPAEVETVATGLLMLEATRSDATQEDSAADSFAQLSVRHPAVRRHYFWRKIEWMAGEGDVQPTRWYHVFGYGSTLGAAPDDIEWAIADASAGADLNREVVLRMAIDRWASAGRKPTVLQRIRAAVRGHAGLEKVLREEVETVATRIRSQHWQRFSYRKDKLVWAYRRQRNRVLAGWYHVRAEIGLLWNVPRLMAGKDPAWLGHLAHEAQSDHHHLAADDWPRLRKKHGWFVALAVRSGCKKAWRNYRPFLPHEDPSPRTVYNEVVAGLSGLAAAYEDGEIDFARLPDDDVRLALRYAVSEINGYPSWLDALVNARPATVGAVMAECVEAEWRALPDHNRRPAILNVTYYQWPDGGGLIADGLLSLLAEGDPKAYVTLELSLGILLRQGPDVRARLNAEAARRFTSGDSPIPSSHMALWFSVWLQTDAAAAMALLPGVLYCGNPDMMVMVCANLHRDIGGIPVLSDARFRKPAILRRLIPLAFEYVRVQDDLALAGAVTGRHDAQDFRNSLLTQLAVNDAPEVIDILGELAVEPVLLPVRDWILRLRDEAIERRAEVLPWHERDIPLFAAEYEIDPRTEPELFSLVLQRLADAKHSVELADQSRRDELPPNAYEGQFRRWLARRLTDEARNRYVVPEEAVVDQDNRPDIRLMKPGVGPVSLELKIAERNWTIESLLERLENQLVGQYMRDHGARCGVFVIGTQDRTKRFSLPGGGPLVNFDRVIELLSERARNLVAARFGRIHLQVVAIDFTLP